MLGWLCVLAKPLGIHARHPCRGYITGAAALTKQGRLQSVAQSRCTTQRHQRLTTRIGATPKARMLWLLAKSFALCKTNRASNAKHPFSKIYRVFGRLKQFSVFINRSRYSATASLYSSPIGPFLSKASRYICVQTSIAFCFAVTSSAIKSPFHNIIRYVH